MKLIGEIAIHAAAEDILRAPKFFEKIKRAFGGKPDLRSGRMRASLEATAIVEAARDSLRAIGVSNAISLVVDDTVLFHDRDGKHDDLGDLFLAFHDNDSVFGQGFKELRIAVEHHEAGLHHVLEVQARSEHAKNAPAVRVLLSGRIEALEPNKGEDAESYRKRAEPIATDPKALELFRVQHAVYVQRVRDALAAAMPTARVELVVAEPRVVRPTDKTEQKPQDHHAAGYDPYDAYYFNPMYSISNVLMWSALFSLAMPPHFTVINHNNIVEGHADDPGIQDGPTAEAADASAAEATDSSGWWDGDGAGDGGDAGGDGGGWWDGGGDGGGFDFGGFD